MRLRNIVRWRTKKTALTEHLLDLLGFPTDNMHAGDQIGQNPRVHLVGLDLRLSYDVRDSLPYRRSILVSQLTLEFASSSFPPNEFLSGLPG